MLSVILMYLRHLNIPLLTRLSSMLLERTIVVTKKGSKAKKSVIPLRQTDHFQVALAEGDLLRPRRTRSQPLLDWTQRR